MPFFLCRVVFFILFLSTVRVGHPFYSDKKDAKNRRRAVRSTFCTNNFLKIPVGNIRDFSLRVPKTAHQQREMIWAVLRQFFQKLLLQNLIPHFTASMLMCNPCATEKLTENSKTRVKSLLSTSSCPAENNKLKLQIILKMKENLKNFALIIYSIGEYSCMIFSAVLIPSTAALIIPPA